MSETLVRSKFLFWSAWTIGLVLNLSVAALLPGTSDVQFYGGYGLMLARYGVAEAYASSPIYNIPPLAAGFSALLATYTGPGTLAFGFWFRLPGILAEAAMAIVLWKRLRPAALPAMVLALNPLSLAITGYHGNLDGLLAICVGAALLAAADERPIASGVWLGLAVNLKISPVLIGPAFFLWWLARGGGVRFATACGLVVLAGWSPGLIACPGLFLERVLGYGSIWGQWGISRLLYLSGSEYFNQVSYGAPSPLAGVIASLLKIAVILLAFILAWRRRRLPPEGLFMTVAAIWLLFLVLAPGGAAQYLIWPLLPLLLTKPRIGLAYSLAALPMLALYYTPLTMFVLSIDPKRLFGTVLPWLSNPDAFTWPGLLLWLFLVILIIRGAKGVLLIPPTVSEWKSSG